MADEIFPWNLSKSSAIKYPSMIITGASYFHVIKATWQ